jgi:hypothetical protein
LGIQNGGRSNGNEKVEFWVINVALGEFDLSYGNAKQKKYRYDSTFITAKAFFTVLETLLKISNF